MVTSTQEIDDLACRGKRVFAKVGYNKWLRYLDTNARILQNACPTKQRRECMSSHYYREVAKFCFVDAVIEGNEDNRAVNSKKTTLKGFKRSGQHAIALEKYVTANLSAKEQARFEYPTGKSGDKFDPTLCEKQCKAALEKLIRDKQKKDDEKQKKLEKDKVAAEKKAEKDKAAEEAEYKKAQAQVERELKAEEKKAKEPRLQLCPFVAWSRTAAVSPPISPYLIKCMKRLIGGTITEAVMVDEWCRGWKVNNVPRLSFDRPLFIMSSKHQLLVMGDSPVNSTISGVWFDASDDGKNLAVGVCLNGSADVYWLVSKDKRTFNMVNAFPPEPIKPPSAAPSSSSSSSASSLSTPAISKPGLLPVIGSASVTSASAALSASPPSLNILPSAVATTVVTTTTTTTTVLPTAVPKSAVPAKKRKEEAESTDAPSAKRAKLAVIPVSVKTSIKTAIDLTGEESKKDDDATESDSDT